MPLEVADAPADLIQRDGDLGEGWYQVCCQLDLYLFVNKDSFLLLDLQCTSFTKSKHLKACLGPTSVPVLDQRGPPLALRPSRFWTGGGPL